MTRAAGHILKALQLRQQAHDDGYHADIRNLLPARSVTHMTLHQTKYMGAMAAALEAGDAAALRRLITDSFVIVLATANILGQDLSAMAGPQAGLGELGCVWLRTNRAGCDVFDGRQVTLRYAALCGRMAKACEALDHLEDFPSRATLAACNADLLHMVVALAASRNLDLETAYDARIAAVEAKSVFNGFLQQKAAAQRGPQRKP